jgi:hypothetical protein
VAHRGRLESYSGPNLAIAAQLLSFNRTQSRAVIGMLTGHNTLRRHLHVMGLSADPICRKCGTEEETSVLSVRLWPHSGIGIRVPGGRLGARGGGHMELS